MFNKKALQILTSTLLMTALFSFQNAYASVQFYCGPDNKPPRWPGTGSSDWDPYEVGNIPTMVPVGYEFIFPHPGKVTRCIAKVNKNHIRELFNSYSIRPDLTSPGNKVVAKSTSNLNIESDVDMFEGVSAQSKFRFNKGADNVLKFGPGSAGVYGKRSISLMYEQHSVKINHQGSADSYGTIYVQLVNKDSIKVVAPSCYFGVPNTNKVLPDYNSESERYPIPLSVNCYDTASGHNLKFTIRGTSSNDIFTNTDGSAQAAKGLGFKIWDRNNNLVKNGVSVTYPGFATNSPTDLGLKVSYAKDGQSIRAGNLSAVLSVNITNQ